MSALEMSVDEFERLRKFVSSETGIVLDPAARPALGRKLRRRFSGARVGSFDSYLDLLFSPGSRELHHALSIVTTNETYFFREWYQLSVFRETILPRIAEENARSRRIAVWSAGCSSGEEAYSVAIMMKRHPLLEGWDVRVIGTDISRDMVRHARSAEYSESSFRTMRPEYEDCFEPLPRGRKVRTEFREACRFATMNLLDEDSISLIGAVDIVLCRNVLIYFSDEAKTKVLSGLYDRLRDGGYLLLGHSESLSRLEHSFAHGDLSKEMIYRRFSEELR